MKNKRCDSVEYIHAKNVRSSGNSMNHRLLILPFLAIAVCLVSAGVGTADDVDITFEGHFGGSTDAVVVSGNYAYISQGQDFVVLDISNREAPSELSRLITDGFIYDINVSGSYAYVADYSNGLVIIDISNPVAPIPAGSYDTTGYSYGVAVSGSYAYVADYLNGLVIIDISNPAAPTLESSYDTAGQAYGVEVSGSYAYVADGYNGLFIIDISNPAAPTPVGSYDTAGQAYGVAVSGSHAYVADNYNGLVIIDISNPAEPTLAGSYDTVGNSRSVEVSGSYAYVADGYNGLFIIDISNPAAPTLTGSYDTAGIAWGVEVSGSYAYVADGYNGLFIIDISNPAAPTLAGSYDTVGSSRSVEVSGSYAYVADLHNGLVIIDISNPAAPTPAGSYNTAGDAYVVAVSGSYAYVADNYNGLFIIDISNPAAPTLAGSYDMVDGRRGGIAVSGSYAYVTTILNGLFIIDISNPAAPTLAGSYDMGDAYGVAVSGSYAYVADNYNGLVIIDISNPAAPTPVGSYDTAGETYGVAVSDSYAYIADGNNGLLIIDISNPATPTLVGSYDTVGSSLDVAVSGSYAYVADLYNGLVIIDISNPAAPTPVGSYKAVEAYVVAVSGSYAYVAEHYGLVILRTDATSPPSISVGQGAPTPAIEQLFIDAYNRNGGVDILGDPTTEVHDAWGYLVQDFPGANEYARGIIIYNPIENSAYYIHGKIWDRYYSLGGPIAKTDIEFQLGLPTTDVLPYVHSEPPLISSHGSQYRYQNFAGETEMAALEYNLATDMVYEIHGAIYATWSAMGYADSILGLVTSDEREAVPSFKGTTGRVSDFENGHLHWHSSGDHYMATYITYGELDELYVSMGGTDSWLGFPMMHQEDNGGYGYCEFEGGYIEWDAASGKYVAKKSEITDGLVAEWHFDEGTGNVLGDSSGNGNDGTIYGATWTTNGKFDSALQFDGNDYIVIPDSPELSGGAGKNLTVEYWFNTNNQGAYIISKIRDVSYKDWSALIGGFGPGLNFWYENRGYDRRFYSGSTIEEGIWHHGAFTFQRSTSGSNAVLKMYLDGNELPLTPFYQDGVPSNQLYDMPDTSAPVSIGYAGIYYSNLYFNGKIDEIRVFDRVLTAEDIKSEFDRGGADNQIVISELLPEHNSHLGSTSVQFSWRTNLDSSSDLFIKRQDKTSYSHYTGNADTFHSITADNLLRNTWYNFYVSSGSKESEIRNIFIDNGIEFTQKSYNFNIERDYSQQAIVTVQNTDSEPHSLLVSVNNPYDDLIVGFIGDGSQDQEITLDPGESRDIILSIFAQDAMLSEYQLQIDLNSIDSNVNDHAVVNLNVRQPNIDFTITEIGADPYTLTKTMQVTNNGDRITDFSIFAEDGLADRVLFKPAVIHANVGTGESLTFKLVPLLESDTPITGFINATGAGHYERIAVDFSQSGGKTLFTSVLSDVTICMGTNSWYCTNRPNIRNTLSIPPGFDRSDVEGAVLAIDFSLPWSESSYRNHNVDISLNGHLVKSLNGIVPNGLYLIAVDPSFLNYGSSGGLGVNQIDISTTHLNGGHYVVATNMEFRLKLNQLTTKLFADSQEEADNVVKSLDILCEKCVPKTEIISVEPSPAQLEVIAGQDVTFDVNVNLKNVQDGALEVDVFKGDSLVANSFRDVVVSAETTETFTISFQAPDVAGSHEYKILTRFREGASGQLIDDSFCDVRQQSSYKVIVSVPTKPQDKTLVKVEGQLEAYWFQNNILYWVTSPKIITKMSGIQGWESVNPFPASVFNPADYEQGPSFITTESESDGLLIREVGDYKVYLIENGKKRHITYVEVMDLKGYSFDDVIEVSSEISNMFQVGEPLGIEVDLYFNKLTSSGESSRESQFTTGDTIKFITETTAGEDYTVETYVRLTYPDGITKKYAYHEKSDLSDPLKFSETEKSFYPGTWNTQTKTWNWNEYTFAGDETEGIYNWEFWYKDTASGNIIGKDIQGYEFSITPSNPIDITPPTIILLPVLGTTTDGITYYNSNVYVSGTAFDPSGIKTLTINGQGLWSIPVYGVKLFCSFINLNEGINEITISAIDNSVNNNELIEKFSINYYPFDVKINFLNKINRFTPEESLNIKGEVSYGTSPFEYKWIIEEFNSVGELQNHAEYTGSTEKYIDLPTLTSGIYEISLKVIDKNGHIISLENKHIIISPNEVDSGFRPNPNGYQFNNFVSEGYSSYVTNEDNYNSLLLTTGGYSWDYFRRAYGSDEVGFGVPSERLANWFRDHYTDMSVRTGGNCYGMSVTSLILYHNSLNSWDLAGIRSTVLGEVINPGNNRPLDFGDVYADTNLNRQYDQGELIILDYNDNDNWDPAPRTWGTFPQYISTPKEWIEYYHALQTSKSFAEDYTIFEDPLTVYNELKLRMASKESWKTNPMVIGMEWRKNGKFTGHAVVPYKIIESNDHKTGTLFIYDNVFPEYSDKKIIFDLVSGTARNPDWNDNNPINVRAIQYTSFYRDDYEMENFDTVTSDASVQAGSLLYTDPVGRFLGYYNGEYKDEIPGASLIIPMGQNEDNHFSETYYISDLNLKRELHGINNGIATVTIFRPNTLIMADIQVSINSVDEINVPPDGSIVEFISGEGTSTLILMLDREKSGFGRLIRITGLDIKPGNGIKLLFSDNLNKVGIINKGFPHSYNFYMEQSGLNPNSFNSLRPVTIGENSAVWITPLDWNDIDNNEILIEYDSGNDGTIESSEMINNYNITFLPPITTMDQYNLKDGSTLPIKFTARDRTTDEFIYDNMVNVTITDSTGHLITYFTHGKGTNSVRINSEEEQYIANFHTKDYAINIGETYSVTVTFGEPDSLRGYDITYFTLIEGGKAKGKGN